VQTSVPIIWHEGPQLESLLAAFPTTLLVYLPVPQSKLTAAKIHLYFLCRFVKVFSLFFLFSCISHQFLWCLVWFKVLVKKKKRSHVDRVLQQGPWQGSLLILQPWSLDLALEEVDLHLCPFWIQVHGLPIQNMTLRNAIQIGKSSGGGEPRCLISNLLSTSLPSGGTEYITAIDPWFSYSSSW
jgi:hypothetical protein